MKKLFAVLLSATLVGNSWPDVPPDYEQTFVELTSFINGMGITPGEMLRGGWLSVRYFAVDDEGLGFNRRSFLEAESLGSMAVSGLFLAVHGGVKEHFLVCREMETNSSKRQWMWLNFGTEEVFFSRLEDGGRFQSLMRTLPVTDGLIQQTRMLMNSQDPLTRRAGLFFGSWQTDDGFLWKVGRMAVEDPDPVNRTCASRLQEIIR